MTNVFTLWELALFMPVGASLSLRNDQTLKVGSEVERRNIASNSQLITENSKFAMST